MSRKQKSETETNAVTPMRVQILEAAAELTAGSRNVDYGPPWENHDHIARIFNAITGKSLTARDIAIVHQATKIARRQHTPTHWDSYVDCAAYGAIEYECVLAELEAERVRDEVVEGDTNG